METPFIYGKLALGKNFTDREKERERLRQNFLSGTNTILISPRRWGKSSLVSKAANEATEKDPSLVAVHIDLFNIRSEEEFYRTLAEQIIRAVSSRMEEVISNVKNFMKQWVPKISFSPDALQEFSLGLNWTELKKQPDEVLDMAENIAISKNIRIILCLDEFQNIAFYEDPMAFQKKLRSHWQKHAAVSYCLYGSKRHMLLDVFSSPSMPFYKFGDIMFLQKIALQDLADFIVYRFSDTGKIIGIDQAMRVARLVDCHPYYAQQLAQLLWLRTDNKVTEAAIDEAFDNLILQMSMLFQNLTESLSNPQLQFLKMLLEGETRFSAKENIDKYGLASSANVIRVKKALLIKEILDEQADGLSFLDPLYAHWLMKYYFL